MRGGFLNLSAVTSRNDMIRAVFESYAMNFKWILELKENCLKRKIEKPFTLPEVVPYGKQPHKYARMRLRYLCS
jgi:hypothetical protein